MKILSARMFSKKLKMTIHKSGRLGFNTDAAELLHLEEKPCFTLAIEDGKCFDDGLLIARHKEDDPDGFKTLSSGKSYYLNTKALFDMFSLNYKNVSFIYDLVRAPECDEDLNGEVYRMNLRTRTRKGVINPHVEDPES